MTNQLFREVLDGHIPLARKRVRPGFYYVPAGSYDPAAPTMADLAEAVEISNFAEFTGLAFDDMAETMRRMGDAVRNSASHGYVMPPPPYPTGNIATQKRRRKL